MPIDEFLDLNKAYGRVQQDKRDDSWPDIINYRDYECILQENLTTLHAKIASPNTYQTKPSSNIDIPKKGFTLRPVAVPVIDDRIVYQAIADYLSPHFQPELCVYSNILSKDINSSRMFIPGVESWIEFQQAIEKLCNSFSWVVETDISAYFECIDHYRLLHRIHDIFANKVDADALRESKQLLQRLWGRWSKGKKIGIPQVNDASSFFANVYLDELDKWMIRQGYVFLRYVDDMRIFTNSEPSARFALAELITQLREIGLHVGAGKTFIKDTADVMRELQDNAERMDNIEAEIKSGDPARLEAAVTMLERFITELISDPKKFNDRPFRFCVNRFKRLKVNNLAIESHEGIANAVLERLTTMPYETGTFVDYLSLFPESEGVQRKVIEFLEGAYNIYPWQEMLLLELLIRLNIVPELKDRALSIVRIIARNDYKHPACREKAFIFWGKNGDYADRREIRGRYHDEPREDVRRAILFAIQDMQAGERNNFLNSVVNDSVAIRMTALYIEKLERPTYHFYNPPAGFDIAENWDSNDIDDLPMPSP